MKAIALVNCANVDPLVGCIHYELIIEAKLQTGMLFAPAVTHLPGRQRAEHTSKCSILKREIAQGRFSWERKNIIDLSNSAFGVVSVGPPSDCVHVTINSRRFDSVG